MIEASEKCHSLILAVTLLCRLYCVQQHCSVAQKSDSVAMVTDTFKQLSKTNKNFKMCDNTASCIGVQ